MRVLELSFKKTDGSEEIKFEDIKAISNWALEYIKTGVNNNVIEGYPDGTFRPQDNIKRGEAFRIICKLLGLHANHVEGSDSL